MILDKAANNKHNPFEFFHLNPEVLKDIDTSKLTDADEFEIYIFTSGNKTIVTSQQDSNAKNYLHIALKVYHPKFKGSIDPNKLRVKLVSPEEAQNNPNLKGC